MRWLRLHRSRRAAPWALAVATLCGSCGSDCDVMVGSASSLIVALPQLLAEFEAETGLKTAVHYASSGGLATSARNGAPFDLLLLAGNKALAGFEDSESWQGAAVPFASNTLVLVGNVELSRPAGTSLGELLEGLQGKRVALGAYGVPAGDYARQWLRKSDLDPEQPQALPVTLIALDNVRTVLTAVESGACDAGFVYASDVANHGSEAARWLNAPDWVSSTIEYPAVLPTNPKPAAVQLRDFLLGKQAEWAAYGFVAISE